MEKESQRAGEPTTVAWPDNHEQIKPAARKRGRPPKPVDPNAPPKGPRGRPRKYPKTTAFKRPGPGRPPLADLGAAWRDPAAAVSRPVARNAAGRLMPG